MKKKIMVFMLLLSFLVGMGVPEQAKAEEETKVIPAGNYIFNDTLICFDMLSEYDNWVLPYLTFTKWNEADRALNFVQGVNAYVSIAEMKKVNVNNFHQAPSSASSCYSNGEWDGEGYKSIVLQQDFLCESVFYEWFKLNVQDPNGLLIDLYTFEDWCSDVGLSCAASSIETEDLYDFEFNTDEFHYIVRRNRISGSGITWYLSLVTLDEAMIYYSTNRAMSDSYIGAAALDVLEGTVASSNVNVRNYVYDVEGNGWLYTDNYGIDLGFTNDYFVDDIGISFSSSMPILFSSTDIYSDKEMTSISYAADTEYKDFEVNYPDISPTSTPTPTPISNSGSTELGGNVIAGGGIDFIISLVSSLWNRLYSIPMNVDGFQISLQQLYVYGILAGIVGAAIFAFTRRK